MKNHPEIAAYHYVPDAEKGYLALWVIALLRCMGKGCSPHNVLCTLVALVSFVTRDHCSVPLTSKSFDSEMVR